MDSGEKREGHCRNGPGRWPSIKNMQCPYRRWHGQDQNWNGRLIISWLSTRILQNWTGFLFQMEMREKVMKWRHMWMAGCQAGKLYAHTGCFNPTSPESVDCNWLSYLDKEFSKWKARTACLLANDRSPARRDQANERLTREMEKRNFSKREIHWTKTFLYPDSSTQGCTSVSILLFILAFHSMDPVFYRTKNSSDCKKSTIIRTTTVPSSCLLRHCINDFWTDGDVWEEGPAKNLIISFKQPC